MQLLGSLEGNFSFRGDRLATGVDVRATAPATQISALNDLQVSIANGVRAMTFEGDGANFACDNRVRRLNWWGVSGSPSIGIDFVAYADNNTLDHGYLMLNSPGSVGVVYNSSSPMDDTQVYENHLNCIVESNTAGTVAVQGNRTYGECGAWTSFVRARLSGSAPPAIAIAPDSDIRLVNSNLGEGHLIVGQPTIPALWVPVQNTVLGSHPTVCPPGPCPSLAVSRLPLSFSSLVPPDWKRYKITLYWYATGQTDESVTVGLDVSQPDVGNDIAAAKSFTTALEPGAAGKLATTDLAVDVPTKGPVMWASLYRVAGEAPAHILLVGLQLTRTL
jgi:hypothetical protein